MGKTRDSIVRRFSLTCTMLQLPRTLSAQVLAFLHSSDGTAHALKEYGL
jgi:hypothetical protein